MNKLFFRIYVGIVIASLLGYGITDLINPHSDKALLKTFDQSFFFSFSMILLLVGLVVYYIAHPIEKRLKDLEKTANELAHGKLNVRANITGNDAVSQLGESFNYMADRIESLIRSQQELTNAISHELRTPIARICFGMEMVAMSTSQEEQEQQLNAIESDLKELDELIDELLTYARLGAAAPAMVFKPINIDTLLKKQCENFSKIYTEINIQLLPLSKHDVIGEPNYIGRAVQNLIGNACRYAKSEVIVKFHQTQGSNIFIVEDDGPGIPEDDRLRIFSPFTRLDDSRTRTTGGYGLGLAIVRRIVRWHQGDIRAGESKAGGAKMSLEWPRNLDT